MRFRRILFTLVFATSCQRHNSDSDVVPTTGSGSAGLVKGTVEGADIDRKDILARTTVNTDVYVKHVLIAWRELGPILHDQIDARAKQRSNAEAAALAKDLANQLARDPSKIDELVTKYSEDNASLAGVPYELTPATDFVAEFKNLALRLNVNETGIVRTMYGYHVMERVAPPPPDPVASNDILARPARSGVATVQHVMIGWKDVPGAKRLADPRAMARTKEEADTLAIKTADRARKGEDFAKLMADVSEDPGSKTSGKTFDVDENAALPFAKLAVRLQDGEVGLVRSPFGWHVVKRSSPRVADSLDSKDILARDPFDRTRIKIILLGWKDAHTEDPRGAARERATLEKLVKATVERLEHGEKIEPLMAQLSEDPLSAKSGRDYTVDGKSELLKPLKDLGLRLRVKEVGVVRTDFGIHIAQRIE